MLVTATDLQEISGTKVTASVKRITTALADSLPEYTEQYGLDQPHRLAIFLAQIAHESAHFKTTTEYASGAAYEGRRDLGNTRKGDGRRYKGRGLMQTTGRANTTEFSKWCKSQFANSPDFVANPQELAKFPWALLSAVFYWESRNLNKYCDRGDFLQVTRRINGGYNGLDDRYQKYGRAALVLLGRSATKAGLRAYQKEKGLTVDGNVGPQTFQSLHSSLQGLDSVPANTSGKPLVKSGTVQGSTVAGGGGVYVAYNEAKEVYAKIEEQQEQLSSGDLLTMLVALTIVAGAAFVFYRRWRDAGSPKPWR